MSGTTPRDKSEGPAEDIPIYPVYEDDDLLVINKQPGIIVHPTKGHPYHTIANGLMKYMEDTNRLNAGSVTFSSSIMLSL